MLMSWPQAVPYCANIAFVYYSSAFGLGNNILSGVRSTLATESFMSISKE